MSLQDHLSVHIFGLNEPIDVNRRLRLPGITILGGIK